MKKTFFPSFIRCVFTWLLHVRPACPTEGQRTANRCLPNGTRQGLVKRVAYAFPNTNLLLTKGCIGYFDSTKLRDWWLGEKYGKGMVHDFNNGVVGWTD